MAQFKDTKARVWSPRLTLDAMEAFDRITEGIGIVEALATQNTSALYRLQNMIPLLFEAVRDQADECKVNYEQFRHQFTDPIVLRDATQALTDAVNDAFPAGAEGDKKDEGPTIGGGGSSTDSPPSQE